MRIPFKTLIKEFNQKNGTKLNRDKMAVEMVNSGVFKTKASALAMMHYNECGKAKSIDYNLYNFTLVKFDKKGSEIIVE